jgi:hypothetical protein
MKKLVFSFFTVVVLSGAFLAEAIKTFPPNDWQQPSRKIRALD